MTPELDKVLCAKYPNLYRDRYAPVCDTAMSWGFAVSNGWYKIIDRLSEKLEAMICAFPKSDRPNHKASQVKEKFGTLRFYMIGETEEMQKAIDEASRESTVTCEECGDSGQLDRTGTWIRTLCTPCSRKAVDERESRS